MSKDFSQKDTNLIVVSVHSESKITKYLILLSYSIRDFRHF